MLENMQLTFGCEIFTLSPVAYITVYARKMVSTLFQAGSSLAESNVLREKRGLQYDYTWIL